MSANDLIGPKIAPGGQIVGIFIAGGDSFHPLGTGPVVDATDPITGLVRHFRYNVTIQDNGDGTTSPMMTLDEITLS